MESIGQPVSNTDSNTGPTYHPSFSGPDADVVLQSLEQTLYRVPSFTLRSTSGFWRGVLSGPSPSGTTATTSEKPPSTPYPTNEPDATLETLLRMISGLEIERWKSFDDLERVLNLAIQWECPGPLAIIRSAITTPLFLAQPLRLYAISTRMGWTDEAKIASGRTLDLSLFDEQYVDLLNGIQVKDLMALLKLHRGRRNELRRMLNGEMFDELGHAGIQHRCTKCGHLSDNGLWRELKFAIFLEMDRMPSGKSILGTGSQSGVEDWAEAKACWDVKCEKEGCGAHKYNRREVLSQLRDCITKKLPTTV